jgi:ribosomal protein L11 methyltransferase
MSEEFPEEEKWVKFRLRPPAVLQEVLCNFLIEQTGRGVQLEGQWITAFSRRGSEERECFQGLNRYYQDLQQLHPGLPELELHQEDLEGVDWGEAWKAFFKPFRLGERIVVKPSWEPYQGEVGDVIIEINPGRAFGTGKHATTALCIELLECLFNDVLPGTLKSAPSVLDVGAGTGILGIVAAKLGAGRVLGLDIDREAVRIAEDNLFMNRMQEIMAVSDTPLERVDEQFDLVMANLTANLLVDLAADLSKRVKPNGWLVLSGILAEQSEEVVRCYRQRGCRLNEIRAGEEWRVLLLNRQSQIA